MPTTQWTLVQRLHCGDEGRVRRALDELCGAYHYPLYSYIRSWGIDHHDAEDALHDFFSKLLRNESFGLADPEKGRLRTYLLTALQRFLTDWNRNRLKRQQTGASPDGCALLADAEERFLSATAPAGECPDRLYDRHWAEALMAQVLKRLQDRYAAKGKSALLEALRPVLLAGGSLQGCDSAAIAAGLGITPVHLRTTLHRLLADYQAALREELLQTVGDRDQAKDELAVLMEAFSRR